MIARIKHGALVAMMLFLVTGVLFAAPAHAQDDTAATVTVDASGASASAEGAEFGISDFVRNNKGSGRPYEGRDIGYRYPMAGENAFVALALENDLLVYLPESVRNDLGFDLIDDAAAQERFLTLLRALDQANANGGLTLEQLSLPATFTSELSASAGGCTIQFGVEIEPGYYYTVITGESGAAPVTANGPSDPTDPSDLATFMETGVLVPAGSLVLKTAPEGIEALWDFLTNMDYRPFWVSLQTSLTALVFVFILGLAAARLSLKVSNRVKDVLDAIFTIPMILPPTVIGFLLLVAFGNSTELGRWLIEHGINIVFTWPAAVIAATVVAFPLMYRTVRGAFEAQDPEMLDAARTLGWKESRIFFKLMLPLAWPSIAAGAVLAFARAMGEFGATLFVAGNFAGVTQTMPIAIYFQWMGGRTDVATFWVFVVILISFVVILFINLYARHTQKYRLGGKVEKEKNNE